MTKYKNKNDIKVGVIGYSPAFNMGREHLNDTRKTRMVPTAVCDVISKTNDKNENG